jgi:hypothetical protein
MDPWQIDCIIDPAVRYVMAQAASQATSDIDYLIVGINMEDSVCTELPYFLIVTGIPYDPPPGIPPYVPADCWWEGMPNFAFDEGLSNQVEASPANPIPGVGSWCAFMIPLDPASLPASGSPNIEFYFVFDSDTETRKILESVNGLMCGTVSSAPALQDTTFYFEVPWEAEPADSHKMHFVQYPDRTGMDVNFTYPVVLADDWVCTQSGPVDRIRFWFSAMGDWFDPYGNLPAQIFNIHVSVHGNIPDYDYDGPLYSMPDTVLWEADFAPDAPQVNFFEYDYGPQGWYDPMTGDYYPDDHWNIFECEISNITDPFLQIEGEVYWLDISIETALGELGWKTSDMMQYPADYRGRRFMDDAVWADFWILDWLNLTYPAGPYMGQSLDLAFLVGSMPQVCGDGRWGPVEWCGQDCYVTVGSTDMTHDCMVDLMDHYFLTADFGKTGPGLSGDFDRDGDVDIGDVAQFMVHYDSTVTPCIPADHVILGDPDGKLHLSYSMDPYNLITYRFPVPFTIETVYVVARDLPSPLGATEFGIRTSPGAIILTTFTAQPPFTVNIGSGMDNIVLAAPAEVVGPTVLGYFQFLYQGEERLSFELVENATYGGLRWVSPSSNVYHDWAMASPAFAYSNPTAYVEPGDLPAEFRLYASAPNPFDGSTAIRYDLPAQGRVKLSVYDVTGKLVRTLVDLPLQGAGRHTATWDGRDAAGREVAPGIYFSRLETGRFSATQRMTLLR